MAWKEGPPPKGTFGWGGIVTTSMGDVGAGFLFADFWGNRAYATVDGERKEIPLEQIALYDNSLTNPRYETQTKIVLLSEEGMH